MNKRDICCRMTVCLQSVLLVLMAFVFFGAWIAWTADYEVTLRMPAAYAAAVSVCALAAAYGAAYNKNTDAGWIQRGKAVCLPLSLVYSMVMLRYAEWKLVLAQLLICMACCIYLAWRSAGKTWFALICRLIYFLFLPLFLLWLFGSVVLSDFGSTRIMSSLLSPQGRYEAQLIDVDEGALGGSTIVDVREPDAVIDIGVASMEPVKRIYRTGWGAFETMQISWKNEYTLLIDGHAYDVRR